MINYDDINLYVNKVNKATLQNKAKVKPKRLEDVGFYKAFFYGTIFWTMFFVFAVWVYR